MNDNYAYISPNYDEIINDIRKEAIVRFFFIMDKTMKTEPKTDDEFQEKYGHIRELVSDEAEKILEYNVVKDLSYKKIKLTNDNLFFIEHDDCSEAVIELAKKIYLKACSALVKKGILEPLFDSNLNDFVFRLVENNDD